MYIGQMAGRTHGSPEASIWSFPGGTIRSDISGATIQSAKLWMYCTGSSGASGSVNLAWLTNSTPPSTQPGTSIDNHFHNNVFPVPGWGSIDISTYVSPDIVSALANSAFLQFQTFLTGSASWFGAGNATFKPYIEITYTV